MRQFSRHRRPTGGNQRGQAVRFWGRHAVTAALDNPDRKVIRAWATREAAGFMQFPRDVAVTLAPREHSGFEWLPWREAADRCFSPSNAEAILTLPRFAP